jgi:hypothetical protein
VTAVLLGHAVLLIRTTTRSISSAQTVQPEGRTPYLTAPLSKAFALYVPRTETKAILDNLSYYQNFRAAIRKWFGEENGSRGKEDAYAVKRVISGAILTDGIIDLFQVAGLPMATEDLVKGIAEDQSLSNIFKQPLWNKLKADFLQSPGKGQWEIAI